jgi:predicted RNA binding protein with dsRBD fold (UPF0201 family)
MEKVTVHIEADVNPTESEEKVKRAIQNVFGSVETNVEPIYRGVKVSAARRDTEALINFRNLLRRERIRAAARTVLVKSIDRNTIGFCLNKQVAYAGHVSFCQEESESPLGPIRVKIECENPRWLIDWLTSENV